MMIHSDKCLELQLPPPKGYETQESYLLRAISNDYNLNTRICRFIGIHNLHSIVPAMIRKGINLTLGHGRVYCPFTNTTPPHPVISIYMTKEQQEEYRQGKLAKT